MHETRVNRAMPAEQKPSVHTRENPSPRYAALIPLYRQLHGEGEKFLGVPADQMFAGQSLPPHALRLQSIMRRHAVKTVLDYGSGKGKQYELRPIRDARGEEFESIPALWGARVTCYDPAYEPLSTLPQGRFDAVVCTDVLEHCPEEDIEWIVDELFSFADRLVYANVASYPAQKRLPTGENAHITLRPMEWWRDVFARAAGRRAEVLWCLQVDEYRKRFGIFGKPRMVGTQVGPLR